MEKVYRELIMCIIKFTERAILSYSDKICRHGRSTSYNYELVMIFRKILQEFWFNKILLPLFQLYMGC